jgi:hypothetical protein
VFTFALPASRPPLPPLPSSIGTSTSSSSSSSFSPDASASSPSPTDPSSPSASSPTPTDGSHHHHRTPPVDPFAGIKHRAARVGDRVDRLGECVGLICAGSERFSLGEVGLLENIPRTATLRAEEPVVLLRIDRAVFERVVKKDIVDDLAFKMRALRRCPLFAALDEPTLRCVSRPTNANVFAVH